MTEVFVEQPLASPGSAKDDDEESIVTTLLTVLTASKSSLLKKRHIGPTFSIEEEEKMELFYAEILLIIFSSLASIIS